MVQHSNIEWLNTKVSGDICGLGLLALLLISPNYSYIHSTSSVHGFLLFLVGLVMLCLHLSIYRGKHLPGSSLTKPW